MRVAGKIIPGHGVASGKGGDRRYPQGTLSLQAPFFEARGLDLSTYYLGTINLDIAPARYRIGNPLHHFKDIDWSSHIPAENFYFFDAILFYNSQSYKGLVYMPDPETKQDHLQIPTLLELIMPKIEGLEYGDVVSLELDPEQLHIQI